MGKINDSQNVRSLPNTSCGRREKSQTEKKIIGFLFEKTILNKLLKDNTLDENSPTETLSLAINLILKLKEKNVSQIKNFGVLGTFVIKTNKHLSFGELTDEQWCKLWYKHIPSFKPIRSLIFIF